MMQKQRGNQHVLEVKYYLSKLIKGEHIDLHSSSAATAMYLYKKHSSITSIQSKFDNPNPDQHPDLTLTLHKHQVPYHLFTSKTGDIQPRNLGGKSFLSKYFNDPLLQDKFNSTLNRLYEAFFKSFLRSTNQYKSLKDYRNEVRKQNITFSSNEKARIARKNILYSLRESTLEMFQELLNSNNQQQVISGLNLLLFKGESMLVSIEKAPEFPVLEKKYQFDPDSNIILFRKGNASIGFTDGNITLYIRFKFESQPHSPIKLTTALFNNESTTNINQELISKFEDIWTQLIHETNEVRLNDPNSIGKVNEALIYHYLLTNQQAVISDENSKEARHLNNLKIYGENLKKDTLEKLKYASKDAVESILLPSIKEEYSEYKILAISLTDDAYRLDIKDNSDIKITLTPKNPNSSEVKLKELCYSLKANAKSNSIPVVKNPGFGTILGANYFRIGETTQVAKELKNLYLEGKLTREEVLESANQYLADSLSKASKASLKLGISTIVGDIPTLHTFYESNYAKLSKIISYGEDLKFIANHPTKINNAIFWNDDKEQLIMRLKFSAGESHGWSSLKLACTYKIQP